MPERHRCQCIIKLLFDMAHLITSPFLCRTLLDVLCKSSNSFLRLQIENDGYGPSSAIQVTSVCQLAHMCWLSHLAAVMRPLHATDVAFRLLL